MVLRGDVAAPLPSDRRGPKASQDVMLLLAKAKHDSFGSCITAGHSVNLFAVRFSAVSFAIPLISSGKLDRLLLVRVRYDNAVNRFTKGGSRCRALLSAYKAVSAVNLPNVAGISVKAFPESTSDVNADSRPRSKGMLRSSLLLTLK